MTTNTRSVTLGQLAMLLALLPFSMILGGFLFSILWRWFAVGPLGAPPLSTIDALGVSFLVSWFTQGLARREQINSKVEEGVSVLSIYTNVALQHLVVFGIAAIVHAFQ